MHGPLTRLWAAAARPPLRDIGAAAGYLKRAGAPESVYALSGRLVLSNSGWLLLDVPNALVRGLFQAMDVPGVELPSHGSEAGLRAHISVASAKETAPLLARGPINELGKRFRWQLGPIRTVKPDGWDEMSAVYFASVESPELKALRRSYGLPEFVDGFKKFHLTVAVRRKGVLRNNGISKGAAEDGVLPSHTIDRPRGFKKTFPTPNGPVERAYPVDYGYLNDYINPDDNEGLDVFVGSGGPRHGRFMKGTNLSGRWEPDERKWYTGLTDDEHAAVLDLFHSQSPGLIRDETTFPTLAALMADVAPYRRHGDGVAKVAAAPPAWMHPFLSSTRVDG